MAQDKSFFIEEPNNPAEIILQEQSREREIKSRRAQLVLRPSVHDALKKIITMKRTTLNEYVQELIIREIESPEGQELIKRYDNTFED